MLRFLPAFVAVESMRRGLPPTLAAREAVDRVSAVEKSFSGAVVAVNRLGEFGAACHGMTQFPFSVAGRNATGGETEVFRVECETGQVSRPRRGENHTRLRL